MTFDTGLPQRAWVDGREAPAVALRDRGLQYGDGLFETLACLPSGVRFGQLHLGRLAAGCERLRIPLPEAHVLRDEIACAARGDRPAVLKLIVTRGQATARGYAVTGHERPTRILLRYPWDPPAPAAAGLRVRLGDLRFGENPQLAGLKHLNRLEQVLARMEWGDPAIAESLHCSSSGALVSGTSSNVFLVRGGALLTPRLDLCGVAGIMREVVGRVARGLGLDFRTCPLELTDVHAAEEIFLTNALTGIRAVRELAGRALPQGPVTAQLQAALAPLLRHAQEAPP
ncbi:MAG: aminodeoxychorismate lyase [Proteobacteria bacterium]|nr:aminodeoxychorismate lyase [Pseudomonadota bacterium]